ncbi:GNAT family N-acetyltransferase [Rhizobium lentis]|uniref:GNAT family N-acetyltransferase n=1 Tax=Rhizobium lentis TaxID=1138194 RepID=A0ABS7IMM8_9HYPH|nr:GNAT family N-acetyltransferase [Rhizobium lentis]MBX5091576.1 GNAT family N-acetyltransferase [Rhizobium lentis]MBX5102809.1 GNAT family N-acetyltransferase [Rhizobium lentis]MBX5147938.1 GNAT family N-acetyltransferase [Rhizobium lentis]
MMNDMSDTFLYTSPLDPRAKPLIDELIHEYDSRYGTYFNAEGAAAELNRYPPEAFAPPDGNFLLLIRNGETIGGGAFKHYDERTAEFKRIWTRSDLRRQGLARKVLVELEAQAARQGYSRIYLTTGFRQPEAVGLYLNYGYTALFDTSADPEIYKSLPFEKDITHLVAPALQDAEPRLRLAGASL